MSRARGPSGLELVLRPARVEASLWRRLRLEAQFECRTELFDRYAAFARGIAGSRYRRRASKRVDRSDFEQFAFEGLLEAIDRFDPLTGVPFTAYARRRIVGAIADGVGRMTEVDAQMTQRGRLERERARSLTASQLASLQPADPLAALSDLAIGLALGLMLEGTGLMAPASGADPRPTPYEGAAWREMQARLVREVDRLPDRERLIIRQHYDTGLSFTHIAQMLGLSRSRVSQIHRSAIDRLRARSGALK
ncbi:sigma-70 family RNA polymerase sigma factor [Allosphingosinicella deserti]|nr:sigma-70 family RNA polymerase sigma factor [Sphingomonas deserti]